VTTKPVVFQLCAVVEDVRRTSVNWAKVLGCPEAEIHTIFSGGISHFTRGAPAECTDCQVAKYALDAFVVELIQLGKSDSPCRRHLETKGGGVFHVCLNVGNRKAFQKTVSDTGVGLPCHIEWYPGGSYNYLDTSKELGPEWSVNHKADYSELIKHVQSGSASSLDEIN
jgi:hypothetical protein